MSQPRHIYASELSRRQLHRRRRRPALLSYSVGILLALATTGAALFAAAALPT